MDVSRIVEVELFNSDFIDHINDTSIHCTAQDKSDWDAKQDAITGAASTVTENDLPEYRVCVTDEDGKIAASDITTDELDCLDGIEENIAEALAGKQDLITTGPLSAGRPVITDENGMLATLVLDGDMNVVTDENGMLTTEPKTGEIVYSEFRSNTAQQLALMDNDQQKSKPLVATDGNPMKVSLTAGTWIIFASARFLGGQGYPDTEVFKNTGGVDRNLVPYSEYCDRGIFIADTAHNANSEWDYTCADRNTAMAECASEYSCFKYVVIPAGPSADFFLRARIKGTKVDSDSNLRKVSHCTLWALKVRN